MEGRKKVEGVQSLRKKSVKKAGGGKGCKKKCEKEQEEGKVAEKKVAEKKVSKKSRRRGRLQTLTALSTFPKRMSNLEKVGEGS